ncbi:unnamed protein product [Acanthoscelides obtectus]|uniref:Uncharacterized protein n=1 Tax=Acanthoscelides obtectus TaxID=200917 RepID=A0A9P0LQU3_ACAOB|nr:unnamed protein product [Acanthoscelides obtectus]CAK1676591.1 hypothetical protein AOBTE_LOCUS30838 [Acanthoscelides obtectus]
MCSWLSPFTPDLVVVPGGDTAGGSGAAPAPGAAAAPGAAPAPGAAAAAGAGASPAPTAVGPVINNTANIKLYEEGPIF